MGFVFALYRATMSPQWQDNAGITTASRRRTEWRPSLSLFPFSSPSPSLFLLFSPFLSLPLFLVSSAFQERTNDVGQKNKRNNGFIISGLQCRSRRRHCSLAFSGCDAECLPKSIRTRRILLALNGRSNLCGIMCCL